MIKFDKSRQTYEVVKKKQFDTLEKLTSSFYNNGIPIDLTGYTISLECLKADNNIVIQSKDIVIKNINEVEVKLDPQITIFGGDVQCQYVLSKDGLKDTTFTFYINIQKSVLNGGANSNSVVTILDDLIKNIAEAQKVNKDTADLIASGGAATKGDVTSIRADLADKVSFKIESNSGVEVPEGGGSGGTGGYVHPSTHPYTMITDTPTKLSQFQNDIGAGGGGSSYILPTASPTVLGGVKIGANLSIDSNGVLSSTATGGGGGTITTTNTLDQYTGATLNEKMVNMFNDLNSLSKRAIPMEITLPSGNIEITSKLVAKYWNNKVFRCSGNLVFKDVDAIEFNCCRNNDIFISRVSSIPVDNSNPAGLMDINSVQNLTKNGIKLSDCNNNIVAINVISGFKLGFHLYSDIFSPYVQGAGFDPYWDCGGTFYNDIYINSIWRCNQGMFLSAGNNPKTPTKAGWVNDNRIYNTFFDCNRCVQIGVDFANRPVGEPTDSYHNNKFYNFGFEQVRGTVSPSTPDPTDPSRIAIDMRQGINNAFLYPRFEGSMSWTGYTFVKEGKNCRLNRYETSGYYLSFNRFSLNTSPVKDDGSNENWQGSTITGAFLGNGTGLVATKVTANKGMVRYEGTGLDDDTFITSAPRNSVNYMYTDTIFAKVKTSTGTIKTIAYTS